MRRTLLFFAALTLTSIQALAELRVTLTASVPSPQPLGTVITFSATAKDTSPGELDYRFRSGLSGQPLRVMRDFKRDDILDWAPYLREAQYVIEVTARNRSTKEESTATQPFRLTPRAEGNAAVITPTFNRLVFLYSAPACQPGSSMRVRFWTGAEQSQFTPYQDCEPGLTRNFYIAGLRSSTEYKAVHEVKTGNAVVVAKEMTFATHTLPTDIDYSPTVTISHPLDFAGCQQQPLLLQQSYATDLLGRVVWYSSVPGDVIITRPLPGGGVAFLGLTASSSIAGEMDLGGHVVRETNAERVSEQLKARGQDPILRLHHEVFPLPGDHIMTLGDVRRVLTDVQAPGKLTVVGSMLIELDENLQVVWTWNEFDHLDVRRKGSIGVCAQGGGCPPVLVGENIGDWTHTNSVSYTREGNLIVSLSAQHWVIKIDYQNGKGSGRILWRLGQDGDFKLDPPDHPNAWFSSQHDPKFDVPGSPVLSLYDNGWPRHTKDPAAHSRGQVYLLDEAQHTARLLVNADLGVWSSAFGSAQRLCNGGYSFNSGLVQGIPRVLSRTVEVLPDGSTAFLAEHSWPTYRSFRMKSMYEQ